MKLNELDNTLMALLAMHPLSSGYELHQVIEISTGYLLRASFSQIYPALNKLSELGLVQFEAEPIKNRPAKKRYALTAAGEEQLQAWLASPVAIAPDFAAFDLRLAFSPLMPKETLLSMIDDGIAWLKDVSSNPRAGGHDPESFAFLDESAVDMDKVRLVWESIGQRWDSNMQARLEWLQELRENVAECF